jgi:hypothetical protein
MMEPRPLPVTLIAWVYIVMGTVGFAYHFGELKPPIQPEMVWIEVIRLVAILCGVYLLRGRNWARWVAVAWMVFHVVVSVFHGAAQVAIHSVFCAAIVFFLFYRPPSARFFGVN